MASWSLLPPRTRADSIFEVDLDPALLLPSEVEDDRNSIDAGDRVVLIVEDEPTFARTVLETARARGFKGIVALRGDAIVALGSLKDFPHPSFYFRRIEQLRQVMIDEGLSFDQATARFYALGSKGLLTSAYPGTLRDFQVPYARTAAEVAAWPRDPDGRIGLAEVVTRSRDASQRVSYQDTTNVPVYGSTATLRKNALMESTISIGRSGGKPARKMSAVGISHETCGSFPVRQSFT